MLAPYNEAGCQAVVFDPQFTPGAAQLALAEITVEQFTLRDRGHRASWYVQLRELYFDTAKRGVHSFRSDQATVFDDGDLWMRDSRTGAELQIIAGMSIDLWQPWARYRDCPGAESVKAKSDALDKTNQAGHQARGFNDARAYWHGKDRDIIQRNAPEQAASMMRACWHGKDRYCGGWEVLPQPQLQ